MIVPIGDMIIRSMTLEDLEVVRRIDRLSFPIPWPERSYRYELLKNPASHLLVAELWEPPRRVIGFVGFWLVLDEAHISTLAVDPDHRRRGVGGILLRAALTRAADRGAEFMTLEVRVSNQAAVELYGKNGFDEVGRRLRYYRDNNEDAILMRHDKVEEFRSKTAGGAK